MTSSAIYPNCEKVLRTIACGGASADELVKQLVRHDVSLNPYAEQLLSDPNFPTSTQSVECRTVQVRARDLGFPDGAFFSDITRAATTVGLEVCPLELAPHFRLQFPEEISEQRVTVTSNRLYESDEFPRGFYLQHRDGQSWLRAYRASDDHLWDPDEWLVFGLTPGLDAPR